nr:UvrD-helicase domain-containing protein [Amaricoccus macauensis]
MHKRGGYTLLTWVGHHDAAYAWAERRRLETHPTTGAAQLVEVRERVEEIAIPVAVPASKPALFSRTPEATLLLCGVPADWPSDVRAATEDTLLDLDGYLPDEARRTRVSADRRDALWTIFARTRDGLAARGLQTCAEALHDTAAALAAEANRPFDHILVDEAQDLTLAELRFLKSAVSREINGLFFAGDIGQRVFRPAFAWSAEGVEIRGRSRSLKVNYRTSRQIRRRADLLLPPRLVELEGTEEDRTGVQSVFDGPAPEIRAFPSEAAGTAFVADWITRAVADGIRPERSRSSSALPPSSPAPNPRSPQPASKQGKYSSPPCTPPKASNSVPQPPSVATGKSFPRPEASWRQPTRPRWRKLSPSNDTYCMSPRHERANGCSCRESRRYRTSFRTW